MRWILPVLMLVVLVSAQEPKNDTAAEDLYRRGLNALTGTGPSRSILTGVDLIRQAAQQGYGPAETAFGFVEETGLGMPADAQQAGAWYRKAAEQGDSLAAWSLGRLYYIGKIPGSHDDAEHWLGQAADAGDPFGAYLLGLSLHARDSSKGVDYLRKAAEQGLPFAQFNLGIALRDGLGVPRDKAQAYQWLLISLQAGVHEAADPLASLEADLGSMNVEKAKSAARDMSERFLRSKAAHGCTGWDGELSSAPSPPPLELQRFCR
jgi:hypothetical protein